MKILFLCNVVVNLVLVHACSKNKKTNRNLNSSKVKNIDWVFIYANKNNLSIKQYKIEEKNVQF